MLSSAIAATLNASSPTGTANFASVKLPAHIVAHAKSAAAPMRRSVAGQIEYWTTLGLALEHNGLTAQEARFAIESYEADIIKPQAMQTAPNTAPQPSAVVPNASAHDDAAARKATVAKLKAQMLEEHYSGRLERGVRAVVEQNRLRGVELSRLAA